MILLLSIFSTFFPFFYSNLRFIFGLKERIFFVPILIKASKMEAMGDIMIKRLLPVLLIVLIFGIGLTGCFSPLESFKGDVSRAFTYIAWNGDADKEFALDVEGVVNSTRGNASGPKIASNSYSAEFPGIYFIWDAKQKDSGYLKVDAELFKYYEGFTLTAKVANTYWDFVIVPQIDQTKTADNCYVFYLPSIAGSKNINMVFVPEVFLIEETPPIPGTMADLSELIAKAEALKAGSVYFPIQVSQTGNGSDVDRGLPWVTAGELASLDNAIEFARNTNLAWVDEGIASLVEAMNNFKGRIKADGTNYYFRFDPGAGVQQIVLANIPQNWSRRSAPLDNRIPSNTGSFQMIPYPFADNAGFSDLLQINYVHNGTSTFGGISLTTPVSPALTLPAGTTIEFDVYYPKSAQGKYMRWRMRTASSDLDSYLRDYSDYNNLNPDWVGSFMGETWFKAHHSVTATTGSCSTFVFELHGETSRPAETGVLLVGNMRLERPDPNGVPLPNVTFTEAYTAVTPIKDLYNKDNGLFMVGAIGTGSVTGVRARHYEIFVDGNNLKADGTHPRGPNWLRSVAGATLSGATTTPGTAEFSFPTSAYQAIRDSGTPGQYKNHGHVMAWYNQAPSWMRQILPETLPSGYNGTELFYGLGNDVSTTVRVSKDMARRVQFNHIVYIMRHFLTTDTKYGSSVSRGIIPFNSWDILNEEIHESRSSELIPNDPNEWRLGLKHTNWLVAMSDSDIADVTQHYIYLLFKFAHIAAPNAQMAAAYKANYASLPDYMKLDGHDQAGSIDAYITANPPKLTYNDYGIANHAKARVAYNMILELNTAWQSDPLYDGRPLIEIMGIQGHDSLGSSLASDNQYAMALYASLVDQGLLTGISYSELDIKMPPTAPGGGALAPATLNQRQADALGYQYALLYKLFTKFAPYVDHIISWGVSGSGWQNSYVLFDSSSRANSGYYGVMNPDKYIVGHEYLDGFFSDKAGVTEYEKMQDGYVIDLDDVGTYVR